MIYHQLPSTTLCCKCSLLQPEALGPPIHATQDMKTIHKSNSHITSRIGCSCQQSALGYDLLQGHTWLTVLLLRPTCLLFLERGAICLSTGSTISASKAMSSSPGCHELAGTSGNAAASRCCHVPTAACTVQVQPHTCSFPPMCPQSLYPAVL